METLNFKIPTQETLNFKIPTQETLNFKSPTQETLEDLNFEASTQGDTWKP